MSGQSKQSCAIFNFLSAFLAFGFLISDSEVFAAESDSASQKPILFVGRELVETARAIKNVQAEAAEWRENNEEILKARFEGLDQNLKIQFIPTDRYPSMEKFKLILNRVAAKDDAFFHSGEILTVGVFKERIEKAAADLVLKEHTHLERLVEFLNLLAKDAPRSDRSWSDLHDYQKQVFRELILFGEAGPEKTFLGKLNPPRLIGNTDPFFPYLRWHVTESELAKGFITTKPYWLLGSDRKIPAELEKLFEHEYEKNLVSYFELLRQYANQFDGDRQYLQSAFFSDLEKLRAIRDAWEKSGKVAKFFLVVGGSLLTVVGSTMLGMFYASTDPSLEMAVPISAASSALGAMLGGGCYLVLKKVADRKFQKRLMNRFP